MIVDGLSIERNDWTPRTWWGERDGERVTYEFPTRALLLEAIRGGYAEKREGHTLRVDSTRLGTRPIRGFNTPMRGTKAKCSCGDWSTSINEAPSAGGERWVTERWFAEHVAQLSEHVDG